MIPLHFGARDRPLFGCYDPAAGSVARRRIGVVLFSPTGWELLRAHRTLRSLAVRLAEAGYDVLRFDYSGTGDSWGDPRVDGTWMQWTQDAADAMEELQGLAGVDRVHLVGLRHGCRVALAAGAAQRSCVGRIVLWDPAPLPSPMLGGATDGWDDAAPSLETPAAILDALARERPTIADWMGARTLRVVSSGVSLPEDLLGADGDLLQGERNGPPCWVEEGDFGAGAVPTALVGQIVDWLIADGRKP